MSKISRSKFQQVVEENKRLLRDIKILTAAEHDMTIERIQLHSSWAKRFKAEKDFSNLMHEAAKEYIKVHRDDLPDFLTETLNQEASQ